MLGHQIKTELQTFSTSGRTLCIDGPTSSKNINFSLFTQKTRNRKLSVKINQKYEYRKAFKRRMWLRNVKVRCVEIQMRRNNCRKILKELPTLDRLKSWDMNVQEDCVLCDGGRESRDHLFFSVLYP